MLSSMIAAFGTDLCTTQSHASSAVVSVALVCLPILCMSSELGFAMQLQQQRFTIASCTVCIALCLL